MDDDFFRLASGPVVSFVANPFTDATEGIALDSVGLGGLVSLFIILILTGRLIPKSTVDRENAMLQAQLEEARESGATARAASLELIKASGLDAESIRQLTTNTQVNVQLVEFLKNYVDERESP